MTELVEQAGKGVFAPNAKRCGAKNRKGKPCANPARANGRCRLHGGNAPAGILSPSFKTGRYSKYLPDRLAGRFEASINDPNLLELKSEIALVDARLEDLLKRVESGEAGLLWGMMRGAYKDVRAGLASGKAEELYGALATMGNVIERGAGDYMAWDEMSKLLEQRRRLVESERKRLIEIQGVITVERAMVLIGAIGAIIRQYVTDKKILFNISFAINELINKKEAENVSIEQID